jgi:hypothetical protein
MKALINHPCILCDKPPGKCGVITPNPLVSWPMCNDCFLWSVAYDHLIDEIRHRCHSAADIREGALLLLSELGKRCQPKVIELYRQELIDSGVQF